MNSYITIRQAADMLGVSDSTIRNFLLKDHLFKGRRFGKQLRIEKNLSRNIFKKQEFEKLTYELTHPSENTRIFQ